MSAKTPNWKRVLILFIPFLFKICPEKNYHWRWNYKCYCGIGINGQEKPIVLMPRIIIPISWEWLHPFILQPKWLKRWYYKKSFEWWDHPSNNHWKRYCITPYGKISSGERDIWTGLYCSGDYENE